MIKLPNVKLRANNVPQLSDMEIEADVEFLIGQYDPSLLLEPAVFDIENFIEDMGLTIRFDDLTINHHVLGRMIFDNRIITTYDRENCNIKETYIDENTVLIDNSVLDDEKFLRSVMAHECTHGIYHRALYTFNANQLTLAPVDRERDLSMNACRVQDFNSGKKKLVTPRDWAEHHAKYGGAALLMNRSAMIRTFGDKYYREAVLKEGDGNIVLANYILSRKVAQAFGTSITSADIRLENLGLKFDTEDIIRIF